MKEYIEKGKEIVNTNKKKLIKRISIVLIILAALGGAGIAKELSIIKGSSYLNFFF
ncbi:hypothetical protein ACPWSR_09290 [Alloiococcus sp. CFN-8]|uniref:hypothetical protein n=1 Tax=Alloiococcus sp. CFN-8 TaxID=3416081 RepID=UPI003CF6570C